MSTLRQNLFLNGHNVAWQDNPYYFHWELGQVVDDVQAGLRQALDRAFTIHPHFLQQQRAAFAYTFRMESDRTAAQRGADVIARFLCSPLREREI